MRIRATCLIRNEAMVSARKALGLTQLQLAELAEVGVSWVQRLEALDYKSIQTGQVADKLAGLLDISVDAVLPPELEGQVVPSRFVRIGDIDPLMLPGIQESIVSRLPGPDEVAEAHELVEVVQGAIDNLHEREQLVLRSLYGMGGEQKKSLGELASELGVAKETVRQIQARACRKLQQWPHTSGPMLHVMGEELPETPAP